MTKDEGEQSDLDELVEGITSILEAEDSRIYSKEVIAEFRRPANVGYLSDPDGIGIADGLCNDTMEITLRLDGERIAKCMFFTDGCGATIACGSRLTREVTGRKITEAIEIGADDLINMLGGLPDDHRHCASLAVIALRNAIRNLGRRDVQGQGGGE
jgi:nitrogen fixation NifU-like protein